MVYGLGIDMRMFKVRNKKTGLFSTGGSWPGWKKAAGKIWSDKTIRGHLSMFFKADRDKYHSDPSDWEVVEYEMKEVVAWPAELYYKKDHMHLILLDDSIKDAVVNKETPVGAQHERK